jgi:hypothetical protein
MLSNYAIKLIEDYMAMGRAVRDVIEEETGDVFTLCLMDHIQLHDAQTINGRVYDLKEVEDLVGPIKHIYTLDDGRKGYSYRLGKVEGVIIMETCTTDSRVKANGGADDDVQTNPSA